MTKGPHIVTLSRLEETTLSVWYKSRFTPGSGQGRQTWTSSAWGSQLIVWASSA